MDHFHTNLIARACLLALIVPSAVSAQWRINASGSSEIDEMRFDLPEQAHEFLGIRKIVCTQVHNTVIIPLC